MKKAMKDVGIGVSGLNDYTMRPGKEARIKMNRDKMGEAQHSAADAFVKREQAAVKPMAGKDPKLQAKFMEFNAEMVSDGKHAQSFARSLTSGLDKKAFPVR